VWLGWSDIRVAGFNMFRTLIYPSSGACDFSIVSPHWLYCSWFDVCWEFGCGWLGVVSMLQAEAEVGLLFFNYHNDARSNIHKIQMSLKLDALHEDLSTSECCW